MAGVIPYLAVSKIIIALCAKDYNMRIIVAMAVIALAGYLMQLGCSTLSTIRSHRAAFTVLKNIRMQLTAKLARVPMGFVLDTPSGKFKTMLVDTVEKLELPLAHIIPELTANLLVPVLMFVYFFVLNWKLALIAFATFPIGLICYMGMMKDYEKRYAKVLTAGKNMDAATVEYIGGIEVIKAFNQSSTSYRKYAEAVKENEVSKKEWFKLTNREASGGEVIIGGYPVRNIPLSQVMNYVSYVSQDNYLFHLSIKENIRIGKPDATEEEIVQAAKRASCHEFITSLPNGYDTIAGDGGNNLSGGEKQRIAIARAILKNSPIIILDEATAFTDPENEAVIQRSIGELINGKTLIVIAHRLSTITMADKIIVMNQGKIEAQGRHEELLETCSLYHKLWEAHIDARDGKEGIRHV